MPSATPRGDFHFPGGFLLLIMNQSDTIYCSRFDKGENKVSKLTAQQKVNAMSASIIGLCELFEQLLSVQGLLIPEAKKRLDNTQELCYQLCPEKEQRDFALCYAAVSGNTIDSPEQTLEETALAEVSG